MSLSKILLGSDFNGTHQKTYRIQEFIVGNTISLQNYEDYSFIYLFTVRDLSLETDKIYPSTRLPLTFLLQNNKTYIV